MIGLLWKEGDVLPLPKKKPDYDAERETKELIEAISEYFGAPFDDREIADNDHVSLRSTAEHFNITIMKARKLLITADLYSTSISRNVQSLLMQGKSVPEIMKETGLGRSSVHSYIPYQKVIYNMADSSLEAERQRQYRVRKTNRMLSDEEIEEHLWGQLVYLQGCVFTTSKGLDFTYKIKGREMFISRKDKSITRASVIKAYHKVQELNGIVSGPKKLGTFGASYLYPIFQRIGIIKSK